MLGSGQKRPDSVGARRTSLLPLKQLTLPKAVQSRRLGGAAAAAVPGERKRADPPLAAFSLAAARERPRGRQPIVCQEGVNAPQPG